LHDRREPELLLQLRPQLVVVPLLQARHVCLRDGHQRSSSWRQPSRLQTRTLTMPSLPSRVSMPTRVGSLHVGQTTITLPTGTAIGREMIPPGAICVPPIRLASRIGRGFVCFFATLRFSTTTTRSRGRASSTRPCLPRSLPESICTRSPLCT